MPDRHSDWERWEIYFLTIFLATRPFLFIGGLLLLAYAASALPAYPAAGVIALLLAMFLFSMVFSEQATRYTAHLAARLVTLGKRG